ncbi:hypothetical protein DA792_15905 [Celeribacter baekdonensis]|jgi:hypothetical protein|uniref:Uncharacterized protein n=1 Tax=Celeribacter baekdonensis TaxID=875171 RepID=A0A2R4M5F2_9RHOB|nr:hypothetical protein DA792_15905 [Celeribacter baekdonensis]
MSCVDLGADRPLTKPEMVFRAAIRADLGPAEEFETSHGTKRAFFPITGGVLKGDGLEGEIISGGADWAIGLPDGSYAVEARYLIRLRDGTVVSILNAGRMVEQEDGAFLGRTRASFEVPKGPHEWLGKAVFFGTAMAEPGDDEHVYIELWEAVI